VKPGKVIGRVVATHKYKSVEGKKILLLRPMTWEEVDNEINGGQVSVQEKDKSIIALDAVGAGSSEYVFYVSSKEACQAFDDDPICHNAVVGIIDGLKMEQ
jgi:ethanolamine utilization protein EutN